MSLGIPFPWLCFTKFNSCAARDWWKYYFLVIMEFISRGIVLGNVLWTSLRDTGINLGVYIWLDSKWNENVEYYFLLKLYEWCFVKKNLRFMYLFLEFLMYILQSNDDGITELFARSGGFILNKSHFNPKGEKALFKIW